jgi:hypothetical protein
LPELASEKITDGRPNGITPAMIDSGLNQLINILDQFLGKLNCDKLQGSSKGSRRLKRNKGFPDFPITYLSSKTTERN